MTRPKFIFISNYINHHQIPFCNAMYQVLKEAFVFIQTEPMEEERIRMGWQENVSCPYVRRYYEEPEKLQEWIDNCAVVLFGGTDEECYIQKRLREKKPVVRYSERLYKQGQWKAISPRGLLKKYKDHTRYRRDKVYMLCSGAYVPSDFHIVRAYPDKLLRWGYFPETISYAVEELMAAKKAGNILWAARFIDWKHPELPLKTAKYLKEQGYTFHMDIIGGGELEGMVQKLLQEYRVEDVVTLQGYRTPQEVRSFMERADIYLVTSDRQEGWGAVVNEAMNSGCAVIGNHMIGAVPFLIKHGENGCIYRNGQDQELFDLTGALLKNRAKCQQMGKNAFYTITQEWNAETAAARLAALCVREGFLQMEDINPSDLAKEMPPATDSETDKDQTPAVQSNAEQQGGKTIHVKMQKEQARILQAPTTGPCSPAPLISEKAMYPWLMKQRNPK